MFEELNQLPSVAKPEFDSQAPALRERLIEAQLTVLERDAGPVIVLLSGTDVLGRSECAKRLMGWLDNRHVRPYALISPTDDEEERPRMWRFWGALPRRGRMGLFLNSWYEGPFTERLTGRIDAAGYRAQLDEIVRFERLLASEGAVILKFLMLLSRDQMQQALRRYKRRRRDAWKFSKQEIDITRRFVDDFDDNLAILNEMVDITHTPERPWLPVASADERHRDLTVGEALAGVMQQTNGVTVSVPPRASPGGTREARADTSVLENLDLTQSLGDSEYKRDLRKQQQLLTKLTIGRSFEKRSMVIVFEGNDAAGKGGAIRRIVQALDPRLLRVIPTAAPTTDEQMRPYLWRFWHHVPRRGHVTIFDRSWYGRVLVERVERLCSEREWLRAYDEITAFESELAAAGVIVVKFWLAIDQNEQLARFRHREQTKHKRHKITDEDWRNRERWADYATAVDDMVRHTATDTAPWTLVEANDKPFARVKVLKTITDRLAAELET